jgi:hypothetical protein
MLGHPGSLGTPAFDEGSGKALQVLHHRLADNLVCLRLVLPEAQARTAFICGSAGKDIGPDCVHASLRTAALTAYASLPGAALVTSVQRDLLTQPPEQPAPPARLSPRYPGAATGLFRTGAAGGVAGPGPGTAAGSCHRSTRGCR